MRNRVIDSKTLLQTRSMLCIAGPGAGALDDPQRGVDYPGKGPVLIFCRSHNFAYLCATLRLGDFRAT